MRSTRLPGERPLLWIGSSKKALLAMPGPVVRSIGMALEVAQLGGTHPASKAWKGLGPGVREIVDDHDRSTFRAVYTVKFRKAIYVLHCFQKKSPRGIETAKVDVDLVARRFRAAKEDYEARYGKEGT